MRKKVSTLTRVFVASALAVFAMFSASNTAVSQDQVPVDWPVIRIHPCNSSTAATFPFNGSATRCRDTAAQACFDAGAALAGRMLATTGVICGPCPFPQTCPRSVSGLSNPPTVASAYDDERECWVCVVTFNGTFHVTCGACD